MLRRFLAPAALALVLLPDPSSGYDPRCCPPPVFTPVGPPVYVIPAPVYYVPAIGGCVPASGTVAPSGGTPQVVPERMKDKEKDPPKQPTKADDTGGNAAQVEALPPPRAADPLADFKAVVPAAGTAEKLPPISVPLKPTEAKPADAKPIEAKPVEAKPADPKLPSLPMIDSPTKPDPLPKIEPLPRPEPPAGAPPKSDLPKFDFPTIPALDAPKLAETPKAADVPKADAAKPASAKLEPFATLPKLDADLAQPVEAKKPTVAKASPLTGARWTVDVYPVDGESTAAKKAVGFYNKSERDVQLTVNGERVLLPAKHFVKADLPAASKWQIGTEAERELTVPASASGVDVVIR